jgi:hypothetical protein
MIRMMLLPAIKIWYRICDFIDIRETSITLGSVAGPQPKVFYWENTSERHSKLT